MTVAALPSIVTYAENGVTTSFAAPFRFKSAGDLVVSRIAGGVETVLLLGADYTVTGGDTDAGGTVTRMAATNGATLQIARQTARVQPMQYSTGGTFPAKSHEEALDRQMLISQEQGDQLADVNARALTAPVGEVLGNLPNATTRLGKFIGFGADPAVPLALSGTGADGALRADLATMGDALTSVTEAGSSFSSTLGTFLRRLPITPEAFAQPGKAITDDWTSLVQTAIDAALDAGRSLRLNQIYPSTGNVVVGNDLLIDASGKGGLLKIRGVDGILLNNSGARNTFAGLTLVGFNASLIGSIAGTMLTVTSIVGTLRVGSGGTAGTGSMLSASGIDTRTMVTAQLSGTPGGTGTYSVSFAQTVSSRPIRFTDAPTANLVNDAFRNTGADCTIEAFVDGAIGGGIASYGAPRLRIRGKTRIGGVKDNGFIIADLGSDNFVVEDGVTVDGTGAQNAGFVTSSAGSISTTDFIVGGYIGAVRLINAGDTALEIGQHVTKVRVAKPVLGPSVNPALLIRDARQITVDAPTLIARPYADQAADYSPIAVTPYYEGPGWKSDIVIIDPRFDGQCKRSFAYFGQSGIRLEGARGISQQAVATNGSDLKASFVTLAASLIDIVIRGNQASGFVTAVDGNFGATPVTHSGIILENNEFDGVSVYLNGFNVTWNKSRSTENTVRRVLAYGYNVVSGAFAPVDGVPGLTVDDHIIPDGFTTVGAIFNPGDASTKGVATLRGTQEATLPEIQYSTASLGPLAAFAGKTLRVMVPNVGLDATFAIGVATATVTRLAGSSPLGDTSTSAGFADWAIFVVSGVVIIQRRGVNTGVSGRTIQWGTS